MNNKHFCLLILFYMVLVFSMPVYGEVFNLTVSNSQQLSQVLCQLNDTARIRNPNNDITINLQKGTNYILGYPTLNNNRMPVSIRANITIQGPEGCKESEMPMIYVNSFPDVGDPIIDFGNGNSTVISGSVTLKNFRMMVRPAVMPNKERYMLKFNQRAKCNIYNVQTTTSTDSVTNMDFRNSHNVEISNCTFTTANAKGTTPGTYNAVGGCLWFRGDLENINIHNNIFRKQGNDEALAFSCSSGLYEENHIRNVSVKDNLFEYGNLLPGSYTNAILVAFNTSSDTPLPKYNNWENIDFSSNTIYLKDHCARVLKFGFSRYDNFTGIRATNNTIIHDYEAADSNQHYVIDFWFMNRDMPDSRVPEIQEPFLIENNQIYASEKIYGGSNGHVIMHIDGQKVNFNNNLVDATGFDLLDNTTLNKRPILCLLYGDNVQCNIAGNRILNLGYQSRIWGGNTPLNNLSMTVSNNYFDGSVQNYWGSLNNVDYQFTDNICKNTDSILLFKYFATYPSNVLVSGNTFYNKPGNSASNSYLEQISGNHTVIWYAITGNTFIGYSPSAIRQTWIANTANVVTGNNIFKY